MHSQMFHLTWSEFSKLHSDKINVGLVDCTQDGNKSICGRLEARAYPALLFFPSEWQEGGASPIKYEYERSLEALEFFEAAELAFDGSN